MGAAVAPGRGPCQRAIGWQDQVKIDWLHRTGFPACRICFQRYFQKSKIRTTGWQARPTQPVRIHQSRAAKNGALNKAPLFGAGKMAPFSPFRRLQKSGTLLPPPAHSHSLQTVGNRGSALDKIAWFDLRGCA